MNYQEWFFKKIPGTGLRNALKSSDFNAFLFLKIFTKLVTYFTGFVRVLLCIVYKNKVSCRNSTILELNLARCLLIIKVNKPKGENHNERGI